MKIFRVDDVEKRAILLKEPEVLKKLGKHPNIVCYIEHFDNESKGEIHMVMEYVDGKELFDHLTE